MCLWWQVIQMFRGCKPEDMPPHVYATAQIAYRALRSTRHDQAIVFLGRSGSGKTTTARHVMHYYTVAAGCVNGVLNGEGGGRGTVEGGLSHGEGRLLHLLHRLLSPFMGG